MMSYCMSSTCASVYQGVYVGDEDGVRAVEDGVRVRKQRYNKITGIFLLMP